MKGCTNKAEKTQFTMNNRYAVLAKLFNFVKALGTGLCASNSLSRRLGLEVGTSQAEPRKWMEKT